MSDPRTGEARACVTCLEHDVDMALEHLDDLIDDFHTAEDAKDYATFAHEVAQEARDVIRALWAVQRQSEEQETKR